jgi:hypothetical protein
MEKKCIYCRGDVDENCVVDFCERCGKEVWGEKMYYTIIKNMEEARRKGDLCHSQTNEPLQKEVIEVKEEIVF